MSQFPNTKGQKTMAESDPVVLPSDQTISVDSNGAYLATELTSLSILSAVQQQSDYETKLVVDNLDVTYLEVRIWNSSTGTFNPPTYYLPNSNTPSTPTPPLSYINPNTFLSSIVSNTTDINLEDTQKLVLTAVTNTQTILTNINNKLVSGTDIGDVTINNTGGASAVNIQDGGNSITVDGIDLDIRNLTFATDKVDVGGSVVGLDATTLSALESITVQNGSGATAVNIQDGGNSITVDGGTGVSRTPTILRTATNSSIAAGTYSVSFASVGTADSTVGGAILKPGETINFDAGAINNTLGAIAYNSSAVGAELLIITLT
jgi:hypothetical protein